MASQADRTSRSTAATQTQSRSARRDVLRAQVYDVKTLAALLRPISFSAVANVTVSEAGLKVTTEIDRSVQAVAYVSSSIFEQFDFELLTDASRTANYSQDDELDVEPPSLDFDISLHTLLECLNVFGGAPTSTLSSWQQNKAGFSSSNFGRRDPIATGSRWARDQDPTQPDVERRTGYGLPKSNEQAATTMRLRWRGLGNPLILLLEESQVVTRCELATYEPAQTMELGFNHSDTRAQAILASSYLLDALQSIDGGCDKVTLLFSNTFVLPRNNRNAAPSSTQNATSSTVLLNGNNNGSDSFAGPDASMSSTQTLAGQPMLQILASTLTGSSTETLLPWQPQSSATSVLEKFSCTRGETVHSYRYSHFSKMIKALQGSVRASLRIGLRGLLSVQLMMPKGTGGDQSGANAGSKGPGTSGGRGQGHGFLEFLIAPLDEDLEVGHEETPALVAPEDEDDPRARVVSANDTGGRNDADAGSRRQGIAGRKRSNAEIAHDDGEEDRNGSEEDQESLSATPPPARRA